MKSEFEPTHEFRGLELKLLDRRAPGSLSRYQDEEGLLYHLEEGVAVTPLRPKPKPGEVWAYLRDGEEVLRIVDGEGNFRNREGGLTAHKSTLLSPWHLKKYRKILNADGSLYQEGTR